MPENEDIITDEATLSPYIAAKVGLTGEHLVKYFERFAAQPIEVREFMTSMETFSDVKEAVASGAVPVAYGTAFAKIISFIAMGDLQTGKISQILQKLGLSSEDSEKATTTLIQIMKPLHVRISGTSPILEIHELPPLTQHIGVPTPSPSSNQAPTRNTIDLRSTKPSA